MQVQLRSKIDLIVTFPADMHKFIVAMKGKTKLSAYLESELKHCEALALRSNPFWVQGVIKLACIVL